MKDGEEVTNYHHKIYGTKFIERVPIYLQAVRVPTHDGTISAPSTAPPSATLSNYPYKAKATPLLLWNRHPSSKKVSSSDESTQSDYVYKSNGKQIPIEYYHSNRLCQRTSTLNWPIQSDPGDRAWTEWHAMLKACHSHRDFTLRYPLGCWLDAFSHS